MAGNWEDVLMGLSFAGAAFAGMTMHNIRTPELAKQALAAETPTIASEAAIQAEKPKLSFTVTAKRLPRECKGEPASEAIAARCEALRDLTRVEVKSNQ